MSKKNIIITFIVVILILILVGVIYFVKNSNTKTNLPQINSADDLVALIDKIYEGEEENIPSSVQTQIIDVTDSAMVQSFTGLENGTDLEYLVVSEPMISSQAYSFVIAKTKDGVNSNEIAKKINDNVDYRKWICVSAEKVYTTSSGNIICLVMSDENRAKLIYEKFKVLVGNIGQEYEKTEEIELPPEMY